MKIVYLKKKQTNKQKFWKKKSIIYSKNFVWIIFAITNLGFCIIELPDVWFSCGWNVSLDGLLNSWGSMMSLTLTVLFHHLYQGDTWSWRKEKWVDRSGAKGGRICTSVLLFETGLNYPDSFGCHWQKTLGFDKLERSGFEVGRFRAGLIETPGRNWSLCCHVSAIILN